MTFSDQIYAEMDRASKALKTFPKGEFGMTPDSVKASEEFQSAKREFQRAFAAVRMFNSQK